MDCDFPFRYLPLQITIALINKNLMIPSYAFETRFFHAFSFAFELVLNILQGADDVLQRCSSSELLLISRARGRLLSSWREGSKA